MIRGDISGVNYQSSGRPYIAWRKGCDINITNPSKDQSYDEQQPLHAFSWGTSVSTRAPLARLKPLSLITRELTQ